MKYKAQITVSLQEDMTDPEGNTIKDSLNNLSFSVYYARKSALFEIGLEAKDKEEAETKADEMCQKLLANTVKDYYKIVIKEN